MYSEQKVVVTNCKILCTPYKSAIVFAFVINTNTTMRIKTIKLCTQSLKVCITAKINADQKYNCLGNIFIFIVEYIYNMYYCIVRVCMAFGRNFSHSSFET